MADITSKGSSGLPHFRNSRAARELYEPVYQNLFTVQITLPPAVRDSDESENLLLENIIKVGGLQSHIYPTVSQSQYYKWAERRFLNARPGKTTMDITLDFEVNLNKQNSAYVLKTLRKWSDLAYDPLTGRTGLKVDYTSPVMVITMYNRANSPFWQWTCKDVFPTTQITAPELDYSSDTLYKITGWSLAVDWWEETII